MTATIAYDRPVKNLIDALSATGHVTHKAYRKTSVTIHHNAGRLSHEGVLNVWKTRPASAHFDVDQSGAVCQYVKVNEYAWATGSTAGNRSSISIEMANTSLSPIWAVADATWQSAARLGAWLMWKVVGARPTASNFFYHSHWAKTACAGPYMDKLYARVLLEAQVYYDYFTHGTVPQPPPVVVNNPTHPTGPQLVVDGDLGPKTITAWQRVMGTPQDGVISKPSTLVKRVQLAMGFPGTKADGYLGPITWRAIQSRLGLWGSNVDGIPGPITIRALQSKLNTGKF